jgi:hypothetical protein
MKRVVILGRGAAGKSTLARHLGEITGLPVIELDKLFWRSGLVPTPRAEWTELQEQLVQKDSWILDGDLGPHDAVEVRLRADYDNLSFWVPADERTDFEYTHGARLELDIRSLTGLQRRLFGNHAPCSRKVASQKHCLISTWSLTHQIFTPRTSRVRGRTNERHEPAGRGAPPCLPFTFVG